MYVADIITYMGRGECRGKVFWRAAVAYLNPVW